MSPPCPRTSGSWPKSGILRCHGNTWKGRRAGRSSTGHGIDLAGDELVLPRSGLAIWGIGAPVPECLAGAQEGSRRETVHRPPMLCGGEVTEV